MRGDERYVYAMKTLHAGANESTVFVAPYAFPCLRLVVPFPPSHPLSII